MIVTIDGINREVKTTQYGDKQRVGLKILETSVIDLNGTTIPVNDRWLNGMLKPTGNGTEAWKKGDQVNIKIVQKGDYLNFTPIFDGATPSAGNSPSALQAQVDDLSRRVNALEIELRGTKVEPDTPAVDPRDDF